MRRKRSWNKFRTGGWVPRPGQSRIFIKRPCVWYITHDNPAGGRGVWNRKPKPGGRGSARVLHTRAPKLARPSFNSNFYLYESCIIVSPLERRRLRAPCSIPSPPRSSLYYNQTFLERGISNRAQCFWLKYLGEEKKWLFPIHTFLRSIAGFICPRIQIWVNIICTIHFILHVSNCLKSIRFLLTKKKGKNI